MLWNIGIMRRESLVTTRPYLKISENQDHVIFVKNWGEIPAVNFQIRRKILFEKTDGKGKKQELLYCYSYGDSKSSIAPGEMCTFGMSIFNQKTPHTMFYEGYRIEEYAFLTYSSYYQKKPSLGKILKQKPYQDMQIIYSDPNDPNCFNTKTRRMIPLVIYEGPFTECPQRRRYIENDTIPTYDPKLLKGVVEENGQVVPVQNTGR